MPQQYKMYAIHGDKVYSEWHVVLSKTKGVKDVHYKGFNLIQDAEKYLSIEDPEEALKWAKEKQAEDKAGQKQKVKNNNTTPSVPPTPPSRSTTSKKKVTFSSTTKTTTNKKARKQARAKAADSFQDSYEDDESRTSSSADTAPPSGPLPSSRRCRRSDGPPTHYDDNRTKTNTGTDNTVPPTSTRNRRGPPPSSDKAPADAGGSYNRNPDYNELYVTDIISDTRNQVLEIALKEAIQRNDTPDPDLLSNLLLQKSKLCSRGSLANFFCAAQDDNSHRNLIPAFEAEIEKQNKVVWKVIREAIDIHRRDRYTQRVYRVRAEESLALEKTQRLAKDRELTLVYNELAEREDAVSKVSDDLREELQVTRTALQTEKALVLTLQAHIKTLETRLSPAISSPQDLNSTTEHDWSNEVIQVDDESGEENNDDEDDDISTTDDEGPGNPPPPSSSTSFPSSPARHRGSL
jgi:hypothetical protein